MINMRNYCIIDHGVDMQGRPECHPCALSPLYPAMNLLHQTRSFRWVSGNELRLEGVIQSRPRYARAIALSTSSSFLYTVKSHHAETAISRDELNSSMTSLYISFDVHTLRTRYYLSSSITRAKVPGLIPTSMRRARYFWCCFAIIQHR
jgi:hypothetical protein